MRREAVTKKIISNEAKFFFSPTDSFGKQKHIRLDLSFQKKKLIYIILI